jgi:hypothetical protein
MTKQLILPNQNATSEVYQDIDGTLLTQMEDISGRIGGSTFLNLHRYFLNKCGRAEVESSASA